MHQERIKGEKEDGESQQSEKATTTKLISKEAAGINEREETYVYVCSRREEKEDRFIFGGGPT